MCALVSACAITNERDATTKRREYSQFGDLTHDTHRPQIAVVQRRKYDIFSWMNKYRKKKLINQDSLTHAPTSDQWNSSITKRVACCIDFRVQNISGYRFSRPKMKFRKIVDLWKRYIWIGIELMSMAYACQTGMTHRFNDEQEFCRDKYPNAFLVLD